ncbi:MAG: sugar-binding domain-containing protein [Terriglobales bacterium]
MTNPGTFSRKPAPEFQFRGPRKKSSGSVVLWIITIAVFGFLNLPVPSFAQAIVGAAPRAEVSLNGIWSYVLNQSQNQIPTSGWLTERIPALPLEDGTSSVWYKRSINVPTTWMRSRRRFVLELEKAGHYAAVYCNGTFMGEHFGQFSPFSVDLTSAIVGGQANEIEIYVHKADTTYVRPGVNINQSSCPGNNPDCLGNAYRSAVPSLNVVIERNWVGLVGDITFCWHPTEYVSDVFVIPSVRNMALQVNLEVSGSAPATAHATVLDGSTPVLTLPPVPVTAGAATLQAGWSNPVLWGSAPYGQPKLYTLQTQLLEAGVVVDTIYTRFGFREVWVNGKDILLNGLKLWISGNLPDRLAPIRYVNDRRPQAFLFHTAQGSGLNAFESHWDDIGEPWLDLADEMGMLVVGTFYCDGLPRGQSEVDSVSGWTNWMIGTAQEWAKARRNHPSLIMWRPVDAVPVGVMEAKVWAQVNQAVGAEDPSARPIADGGGDVDTWDEEINTKIPVSTDQCDDGFEMARKLAGETKPLLTREIYGDFSLPCVGNFLADYYRIAWKGGGAGIIFQLPTYGDPDIIPTWFSISGQGNRPVSLLPLPNWMTRKWTPTPLSDEFAGLYEQYFQPTLLDTSPTSGDYQASGLPTAVQTAFLVSSEGVSDPVGVIEAEDGSGTAWFIVPEAGNYQLVYTYNGHDVVQSVTVTAPPPF